jgi:hypothetical protein
VLRGRRTGRGPVLVEERAEVVALEADPRHRVTRANALRVEVEPVRCVSNLLRCPVENGVPPRARVPGGSLIRREQDLEVSLDRRRGGVEAAMRRATCW